MPIVRLPSSAMKFRPIRLPRPVFFRPREISTATTINQMSGLEKLPSASAIAPFDDPDVTCDSATITIAISAMTPIGMTFRMMATMVVRKIATSVHAPAVKPAGCGIASSVSSTAVVISAGIRRNGTA